MKKSELKKIQNEYGILRLRLNLKKNSKNYLIQDKLKELEHKYFHETGREISSDTET